MRWLSVDLIVLAMLVSVWALEGKTKHKRDLLLLKDLLQYKLNGTVKENRTKSLSVKPVVIREEGDVKYFELPGFDNALMKAVPKSPIQVMSEYDSAKTLLESYLDTQHPNKTGVALRGLKNFLESGVLLKGMPAGPQSMNPILNYAMKSMVLPTPISRSQYVVQGITPAPQNIDYSLVPQYFQKHIKRDHYSVRSNGDVLATYTNKPPVLPLLREIYFYGKRPNRGYEDMSVSTKHTYSSHSLLPPLPGKYSYEHMKSLASAMQYSTKHIEPMLPGHNMHKLRKIYSYFKPVSFHGIKPAPISDLLPEPIIYDVASYVPFRHIVVPPIKPVAQEVEARHRNLHGKVEVKRPMFRPRLSRSDITIPTAPYAQFGPIDMLSSQTIMKPISQTAEVRHPNLLGKVEVKHPIFRTRLPPSDIKIRSAPLESFGPINVPQSQTNIKLVAQKFEFRHPNILGKVEVKHPMFRPKMLPTNVKLHIAPHVPFGPIDVSQIYTIIKPGVQEVQVRHPNLLGKVEVKRPIFRSRLSSSDIKIPSALHSLFGSIDLPPIQTIKATKPEAQEVEDRHPNVLQNVEVEHEIFRPRLPPTDNKKPSVPFPQFRLINRPQEDQEVEVSHPNLLEDVDDEPQIFRSRLPPTDIKIPTAPFAPFSLINRPPIQTITKQEDEEVEVSHPNLLEDVEVEPQIFRSRLPPTDIKNPTAPWAPFDPIDGSPIQTITKQEAQEVEVSHPNLLQNVDVEPQIFRHRLLPTDIEIPTAPFVPFSPINGPPIQTIANQEDQEVEVSHPNLLEDVDPQIFRPRLPPADKKIPIAPLAPFDSINGLPIQTIARQEAHAVEVLHPNLLEDVEVKQQMFTPRLPQTDTAPFGPIDGLPIPTIIKTLAEEVQVNKPIFRARLPPPEKIIHAISQKPAVNGGEPIIVPAPQTYIVDKQETGKNVSAIWNAPFVQRSSYKKIYQSHINKEGNIFVTEQKGLNNPKYVLKRPPETPVGSYLLNEIKHDGLSPIYSKGGEGTNSEVIVTKSGAFAPIIPVHVTERIEKASTTTDALNLLIPESATLLNNGPDIRSQKPKEIAGINPASAYDQSNIIGRTTTYPEHGKADIHSQIKTNKVMANSNIPAVKTEKSLGIFVSEVVSSTTSYKITHPKQSIKKMKNYKMASVTEVISVHENPRVATEASHRNLITKAIIRSTPVWRYKAKVKTYTGKPQFIVGEPWKPKKKPFTTLKHSKFRKQGKRGKHTYLK